VDQRVVEEPQAQFAEKKNPDDVRLAETPKGLISRRSKDLRELSRENIASIGAQLAQDIANRFEKLPKSQKLNAIKGPRPKKFSQYKTDTLQLLTDTAAEALTGARKAVPGSGSIKLAEFEDLPPKIKKQLKTQSDLLVGTQMDDLEKSVFFQFTHSVDSTTDPRVIQKDLEDAANDFAKSASVTAGAGNTVAQIVNTSRQAFFFDEQVINQISAFRFSNPDPISPICKDLQGRVFGSNDAESARFFPPLHHNCKSFLVPVLSAKNPNPKLDPRGLSPSTQAAAKSITLSELNPKVRKHDEKS
jgi:SPP1 gp7 family putative phage head morphogenesis protein